MPTRLPMVLKLSARKASLAGFFWVAAMAGAVAAGDAGLSVGRPLESASVRWESGPMASPLPSWATRPMDLSETGAVFPVPALWQRPAFERLVLTVVFDDTEDGGPVVIWYPDSGGAPVWISPGLGESPTALGLHARKLLLPTELTDFGGRLEVSLNERPGGLRSATLQPARHVTLAVIGAGNQPAVVDRSENVLDINEVDGQEELPLTGDVRDGTILEAELVSTIEPFDSELEFLVPVSGKLEGGILKAEVLGLEPGSRVLVEINGHPVGEMSAQAFRLDDPAVMLDESGFLTFAGWRDHFLFLPGLFWNEGENSIIIKVQHGPGPLIRQVSIKNVCLHLRFGTLPPADPTLFSPGSDVLSNDFGLTEEPPPESPPEAALPTPETGEAVPDFVTPSLLIEEPPVVPNVVTTPPRKTTLGPASPGPAAGGSGPLMLE